MSFQLSRNEGLIDLDLAAKLSVIVVGKGSLGSYTTDQLAYPFGMLYLIDPKPLKAENVERHLLGKSYVKRNKAEGMKDFLVKERGIPAKNITAFAKTFEEVKDQLPTEKVVVFVCVDDPITKRNLNAWCVRYNIPAIYGGIAARGTGGTTITIPTPQEVCYMCSEHARNRLIVPAELAHDYGVNPATVRVVEGVPTALPALKKAVVAISSDMIYAGWPLLFPGGEALKPTILSHALDGWMDIGVQFKGVGGDVNALMRWVASNEMLSHSSSGLSVTYPMIRLTPPDREGWQSVEVFKSPWPRKLFRWDRCDQHGGSFSASDL